MGIAGFLKRSILSGNLLLLLLVVDSSEVNFKEKGGLNGTKNLNEQVGGIRFGSDPIDVSQVEKEEQLEDLNGVVQKDLNRSNISKPLKSKDQKIHDDSRNVKLNKKNDDNGKIKGSGEVVDSKSEPTKINNEDSNGSLVGIEKEKLRDDECDLSNMCVDEKKNLTACLRVPGNDSPDLSLLIQNKGSESVIVTITAPQYVQLEETKVQLQQKEDKKVKVTVAYEAMDSLILLTTENTRCTLDFKELIPRDARTETRYGFKLRYFNSFTRTHFMILLTLFAFVIFGSAWMCSGLCKKLYQGNGYHQIIDMELPISGGSKRVPESSDSWDDSWDDSWEDEEAPKTPQLPVTPNLSSRGLASRRLNKDVWKD
ncbi:Phosphate acyltransferase [Bienertia sinuspersici]